jgi:hypothetical protein
MNDIPEKDVFTKIVNHASKNERVAWNRKHKKLKDSIEEKITPLEMKILEITMEKQVYMDEVLELRATLVKECVHPREFLMMKEDHVLCKFCNRKLKVNV